MDLLIDYETYCDLSLKEVGAHAYVNDDSFRPLCMYYVSFDPLTLKSGIVKGWTFQDHYKSTPDLSGYDFYWAFNVGFDLTVARKNNIFYFPLDVKEWKDVQGVCSKFSLPQNLKDAAIVLKTETKKRSDGPIIINRCCKNNRNVPLQADYNKLFLYCKQDIDATLDVLRNCPSTKVSDYEWDLWRATFNMNARGINIDYPTVYKVKERVDAYKEVICDSLPDLTDGVITKPTQTARIKKFLIAHGINVPNTTAETLEALMDKEEREPFLPAACKQLIEARQAAGASSVAKFDKLIVMKVMNRVHDFLRYGATNTQRWSGAGYQVHSLPKKSVDDPEALIKLFMEFGEIENPMQSAKALCRSVILSLPGQMLYQGDYSSIEYLLLIWLTDMHDMLQMFKQEKSAYIDMAAYLFKKKYSEIDKHATDNLEYFLGKQVILGCISEGTLVLTNIGLVPIEELTKNHMLWDGDYWVSHQGLLNKGKKKCIKWNGIYLTSDHEVFVKNNKKEACRCQHFQNTQQEGQAITLAFGKLKSFFLDKKCLEERQDKAQVMKLNVPFVAKWLYNLFKILKEETVQNAGTVEENPFLNLTLKRIVKLQDWIQPQLKDLLIVGMLQKVDVLTQRIELISGMEHEELKCTKTGLRILEAFYFMLKQFQVMKMKNWNWIELTMMGTMNQEISDSLPTEITCLTHDILEAGSQNRFTVLTPKGYVIVSNCGYQMGAPKFRATCKKYGVDIPPEMATRAVKGYRTKYKPITKLWKSSHACCVAAIRFPGQKYEAFKCQFVVLPDKMGTVWLIITLPSNTKLYYHSPELSKGQYGPEIKHMGILKYKWVRRYLSPGRITENIIQKLARDLMGYSIYRTEENPYFSLLMTVHDELVATGDNKDPELMLKMFLNLMQEKPKWAKTIPLRAGGYYGRRYRKD